MMSLGDTGVSTWDYHAGYKWLFFTEREKQLVAFWLANKVNGPTHIELGSGWYESVPGSVAVDFSGVSLEQHPAIEKYRFNLDTLTDGARIPVENNRFQSASMISVWQYLADPKSVLTECERILLPGSELYIINNKNAGLQELKKQPATILEIANQITELGYQVTIEDIYVPGYNLDEWQCAIVKMPGDRQLHLLEDIRDHVCGSILDSSESHYMTSSDTGESCIYDGNGEMVAIIGDSQNPFHTTGTVVRSKLSQDFLELELLRARYYFTLLQRYSPTEYSKQFLQKVKQKAEEVKNATRNEVLIWFEGLEVEFNLMREESKSGVYIAEITNGAIDSACTYYSSGIGVYNGHPIQKILASENFSIPLHQWDSGIMPKILNFLSYSPLDDFTKEQQVILLKKVIQYAKKNLMGDNNTFVNWEKRFFEELQKRRVLFFYNLFNPHKQERKVVELLKVNTKQREGKTDSELKTFATLSTAEWILFKEMLSKVNYAVVYE